MVEGVGGWVVLSRVGRSVCVRVRYTDSEEGDR